MKSKYRITVVRETDKGKREELALVFRGSCYQANRVFDSLIYALAESDTKEIRSEIMGRNGANYLVNRLKYKRSPQHVL